MRIDGRNLSLIIGGIEVSCDSTSVLLDNEQADADMTTFGDVIAGNDRRWFITITALPDYHAPGKLWSLLWNLAPFTPIAYSLTPYGLGTPPTFQGEAMLDQPPPIGGDAGSVWTFDTRLTCTAEPLLTVPA